MMSTEVYKADACAGMEMSDKATVPSSQTSRPTNRSDLSTTRRQTRTAPPPLQLVQPPSFQTLATMPDDTYTGPINPDPQPGEADVELYGYVPSAVLGVVGVLVFLIVLSINTFRWFKNRKTGTLSFYFFLAFGALLEAAGYGCRIASHNNPYKVSERKRANARIRIRDRANLDLYELTKPPSDRHLHRRVLPRHVRAHRLDLPQPHLRNQEISPWQESSVAQPEMGAHHFHRFRPVHE
jgi:hypothetical protein